MVTNAVRARDFVDNTPGRAQTGFRFAADDSTKAFVERVIMDLETGEFSVQVVTGPDSGAVRRYCVRDGSRAERWQYFLDQFA